MVLERSALFIIYFKFIGVYLNYNLPIIKSVQIERLVKKINKQITENIKNPKNQLITLIHESIYEIIGQVAST